jgi:hypothetical protein
MDAKPTHEQAQLQLKLYDMRREARLRVAREWFFKNYFVENMDDWLRIGGPGTPTGAFSMMVLTYWDQACAMLNYGLLHEDLFFETSGEFFGVFDRVRPVLPQARQRFANPHFLENLEKTGQRYESWTESRSPGQIAAMRQMMKQMRPPAASAA